MLGPQNDIVTHRQALPRQDVAAAIETVRTSQSGQPAVKLAFEFLVLTATRSGEVRLATWEEMDTAGRVWSVPALRMKAKREHRVDWAEYLAAGRKTRAVEVEDLARRLTSRLMLAPARCGLARRQRPSATTTRAESFGRKTT